VKPLPVLGFSKLIKGRDVSSLSVSVTLLENIGHKGAQGRNRTKSWLNAFTLDLSLVGDLTRVRNISIVPLGEKKFRVTLPYMPRFQMEQNPPFPFSLSLSLSLNF
jgi:hypothetical protein